MKEKLDPAQSLNCASDELNEQQENPTHFRCDTRVSDDLSRIGDGDSPSASHVHVNASNSQSEVAKDPASLNHASVAPFQRKRGCQSEDDSTTPLKVQRCLSPQEILSKPVDVLSLSPSTHVLRSPNYRGPLTPQMCRRIPTRDNPPPSTSTWLEIFREWNHAERVMGLDMLLNMCEPLQIRHLWAMVEPKLKKDFISDLPKELALRVLSYLSPDDLARCSQSCRYWDQLIEDPLLWKMKCSEVSTVDPKGTPLRRSKWLEAHNGRPINDWKQAYVRYHELRSRWKNGKNNPPKVLKGHDDHVITCLQFSGDLIVSGSDDNTLRVWSAKSGKCVQVLLGHTGGVWASEMRENIVISGSTDRTIRVWNALTGECMHTLYGHTSTVRCLALNGRTVVSGSRDASLRVWDIDTGECLRVLTGHVAAVRCVCFDGKFIVSGAYDYTVRVWRAETDECVHIMHGHTNRVYSLQFDGKIIVSGSLDTSIRVWDVETGRCLQSLVGHQSLTSGMQLSDSILVSGNADSTVRVWDIKTGACLHTLSGTNKHQSAVTSLQFSRDFIITSSDDGTVKLWSMKTGEFIRNLVTLESGMSGGVVWRVRVDSTRLVCAVGSRNGTEDTKLLIIDFDDPKWNY